MATNINIEVDFPEDNSSRSSSRHVKQFGTPSQQAPSRGDDNQLRNYEIGTVTEKALAATRSAGNVTPGKGKFKPFTYDGSIPRYNLGDRGSEVFLNFTEEDVEVGQEIHVWQRRQSTKWIFNQGEPMFPKQQHRVKGVLAANLPSGAWGDMSLLRCIWPPDIVMPPEPIRVQNCTADTLESGPYYEAQYNCNCRWIITNCCQLVAPDCPTCIEECEDTYEVILPSDFSGPCACQAGQAVPFLRDVGETCEWDADHLIDECSEGPEGTNWCVCTGDPASPPPPCVPDPIIPDCRHCTGSVTCYFCRANCGHGLRHVAGRLWCNNNFWNLEMNSGTPGLCPEIAWTATKIGTYEADGRCPPERMLMDFVVANGCVDPDLQCASFQAEVEIRPV